MQDGQQAGQGAGGRIPARPGGAAARVPRAPNPAVHPVVPANVPNAPAPNPAGAGDGAIGQHQGGAGGIAGLPGGVPGPNPGGPGGLGHGDQGAGMDGAGRGRPAQPAGQPVGAPAGGQAPQPPGQPQGQQGVQPGGQQGPQPQGQPLGAPIGQPGGPPGGQPPVQPAGPGGGPGQPANPMGGVPPGQPGGVQPNQPPGGPPGNPGGGGPPPPPGGGQPGQPGGGQPGGGPPGPPGGGAPGGGPPGPPGGGAPGGGPPGDGGQPGDGQGGPDPNQPNIPDLEREYQRLMAEQRDFLTREFERDLEEARLRMDAVTAERMRVMMDEQRAELTPTRDLYQTIADSLKILQKGTKGHPKAILPTPFDGQNVAPMEFLEHLEDYFKVLMVTDDGQKRDLLKQCVTGSAWYLLKEMRNATYGDMKQALIKSFASEGAKMARRQQLQKRKLTLGGDLEQYLKDVLSDAQFIGLSERETVVALKNGLQGMLSMCVELDKPEPTITETCLSIRTLFNKFVNDKGKPVIGQVETEKNEQLEGLTNGLWAVVTSLNQVKTGVDTLQTERQKTEDRQPTQQENKNPETSDKEGLFRGMGKCFYCGQPGHWMKECGYLVQRSQWKAQGAPQPRPPKQVQGNGNNQNRRPAPRNSGQERRPRANSRPRFRGPPGNRWGYPPAPPPPPGGYYYTSQVPQYGIPPEFRGAWSPRPAPPQPAQQPATQNQSQGAAVQAVTTEFHPLNY